MSMPPTAFETCAACHPVSHDGAHAMGPNLRGVVGRQAGTAEGFLFSNIIKSSDIVWSEATLDTFIRDPAGQLPGNTMLYAGLPDARQRADIIQYLQTLN